MSVHNQTQNKKELRKILEGKYEENEEKNFIFNIKIIYSIEKDNKE
jgi:hypothetical protein